MTSPDIFTPYSTLRSMFPASRPTWIPDDLDQQRIMSYQLYEQIYWNVPDTFKLTWRGTEDKPIYIPTSKVIINTTARFVAPKLTATVEPIAGGAANSAAIVQAQQFWIDFLTREEFASRFTGNKLYGLIRGDWLWHVTADPMKAPGTKISLRSLDPGMYFPIYDPDDVDRILGIHIVDQFIPPSERDVVIKRTSYRKPGTEGNPSDQWVSSEIALFETDDWGGPKSKPKKVIRPPMELPGITSLPVYHVKNFDEPQNPFGSSELRGIERLAAAVNQAISDEELSLALDGLGVYATDADPPVNEDGTPSNWILGPGRVVEHQVGRKFARIGGVGSVTPYMDHLAFLIKAMKEASQTPDVAIGNVEVSVAQSGIALAIQFSPMLAKAGEKNEIIFNKHNQLWYDLATQWFPVYEKTRFDGMRVVSTIDDAIPVDRQARRDELNDMLDRHVISRKYYRQEMTKLGYVFDETSMQQDIEDEEAALAIAADPFTNRLVAETDNADSGGTEQEVDDNGSETS